MIKPWIFTFLKPLGRQRHAAYNAEAAQATYDYHLDLLPLLEDIGFEGVFFSEHHFFGNLSPSPNLLIAAAAQRTAKLRLGVMGQVLPLYPPFRIAEEVGMLDLLTHGRLEIGYSSGAGPMEPLAAGIPQDQIRPRYAEALDIIELALRESCFSYQGNYHAYEQLAITPRTLQPNLPPRWITVLGAASATDAARRGCRICTGFLPTATIKSVFDAYRLSAATHNMPNTPSQLGIRRQILVWDNDSEAEQLGKELQQIQIRELETRARAIERSKAGLDANTSEDGAHHVHHDVPDMPIDTSVYSGEDECIFGSPKTVAAKIIEQCTTTGAGHILAYTFSGLDAGELTHSMRLWQTIIPELRKAGVALPA